MKLIPIRSYPGVLSLSALQSDWQAFTASF